MKESGPLDIEIVKPGGTVTVLALTGEIDIYTAPRLRDALDESIGGGAHHIVVDLEGVPFIDSSGLGVLVVALRRLKECDGAIHLVCERENVIRAFRLTGLLSVFPLHASREEAIAGAAAGD
jgi:anti-sigma B factor antagonist